MSVTVESATVYRAAGRRYLTKRGALLARGRQLQKQRLADEGDSFWDLDESEKNRLQSVCDRFARLYARSLQAPARAEDAA